MNGERDTAEQLIADILEDYKEDTPDICSACAECGIVFMCRFHSLLSAIAGNTWTNAAVRRDRLPPYKAR